MQKIDLTSLYLTIFTYLALAGLPKEPLLKEETYDREVEIMY